jgi:ATP-binding cassette subfamily B protein
MIRIAWRVSRTGVLLTFIHNTLDYGMWVLNSLIFLRSIIGAIERGAGFGEMVVLVSIFLAIIGVHTAFSSWYNNKYRPEFELAAHQEVYGMLYNQASNVELACYEDPDFYNKYTLAIKEADHRLGQVLTCVCRLTIIPFAFAYIVWQMFMIDKYLFLFAVLPLIGTFVFDRMNSRNWHNRGLGTNPHDRKKWYVNRVFYLAQYAKEIRLSNVSKILNRQYGEGYEGAMAVFNKYGRRIMPVHFLKENFTYSILFNGILIYGAYRAIVSQTIATSEFVILVAAMSTATWMLRSLSDAVTDYYQNGLYVQNLRVFLEHKPEIPEDHTGETVGGFNSKLELRSVGFKYKGSEDETLKNINLTIKKGEKIAILGHNGAGKSTLIKLLLRMYDPTSGEILLDGKDIRDCDLQSYRGLFSAAFQDQRVFSMSVADNVSSNRETAINALKLSGAWSRVERMKNGVDSVLTREFDDEGVVLSGGETQKVSVARAFARDFDIGIFDEPSSALDPVAEYELFESMMQAFAGKTVIFISHRMSSARLADRVYLFENGKVIEEGSHGELMRRNGAYAEMFRKQAENYIRDEYALIEGVPV